MNENTWTLGQDENLWKRVVVEKLIVSHIYKNAHEDDPEAAVNDLISWEVAVALDPCVSSAAAALTRVAVDCRTCAKSFKHGSQCRSTAQCVNGDQYVAVQPVQLWEKKDG